jgi:hypothetical protein
MKRPFSDYLPVLQKLGNSRMSYCIFIDDRIAINVKEVCLDLPVSKTIVLLTDRYHERQFVFGFNKVIRCNVEDLLDTVVASETLITVVIGDISVIKTMSEDGQVSYEPITHVFNEIHTCDKLRTNLYGPVIDYDNHTAYVQSLINDPNIVAIFPINIADALYPGNFFDTFKSWHTLLVNKETKEAVQIIWDLREIVGYGYLSEEQFKLAMSCKNANDNSRLLYAKPNKFPKGFERFIIDYITN